MPQVPGQKKKKKGHAPAHQNTFAFHHNPKSKKTAVILSLPIQHVCRRCRDKLEWRKQYRKYKPLTAPAKCNHCHKRNVMAAYHTICESCSRTSPQCKALLKEWNLKLQQEQQQRANEAEQSSVPNSSEPENVDQLNPAVESLSISNVNPSAPSDGVAVTTISTNTVTTTITPESGPKQPQESTVTGPAPEEKGLEPPSEPRIFRRVCAICVKEHALPADDDEVEDDGGESKALSSRPLRLRQLRTLERQEAKARAERRRRRTNAEEEKDEASENSKDLIENDAGNDDDEGDIDDDDDDEEDPFLKAVGGADKLLTGEAYQQMLLQREAEKAK